MSCEQVRHCQVGSALAQKELQIKLSQLYVETVACCELHVVCAYALDLWVSVWLKCSNVSLAALKALTWQGRLRT